MLFIICIYYFSATELIFINRRKTTKTSEKPQHA